MAKTKAKVDTTKYVTSIWSIDDSDVPITITVRELLKVMVAQHPGKNVSVWRIYTNFKMIGGLTCEPRTNEKVTVMYYNTRIPTMSTIRTGVGYIEVLFKIEDKPAS